MKMRKGLTMLELMVVVTILGIMSSATVSIYGQISRTNDKKTAETIMSSLVLARTGKMTKTGEYKVTLRTDGNRIYMAESWIGSERLIGNGTLQYQIDSGTKTDITGSQNLVLEFNRRGGLASPSCSKIRIFVNGRDQSTIIIYGLTGVSDYE